MFKRGKSRGILVLSVALLVILFTGNSIAGVVSTKDKAEITAMLKRLGDSDLEIQDNIANMERILANHSQKYTDSWVAKYKADLTDTLKARQVHEERAAAVGKPSAAVENGKELRSVKVAQYDTNGDNIGDIEVRFVSDKITHFRYLNKAGRAFCNFIKIGDEPKKLI
jgi:hypothetical protein